jgi:hypothetical protein
MLLNTCPPAGQAPAVRELLAELDAEELRLRALAAEQDGARERLGRRIAAIRLERSLLGLRR